MGLCSEGLGVGTYIQVWGRHSSIDNCMWDPPAVSLHTDQENRGLGSSTRVAFSWWLGGSVQEGGLYTCGHPQNWPLVSLFLVTLGLALTWWVFTWWLASKRENVKKEASNLGSDAEHQAGSVLSPRASPGASPDSRGGEKKKPLHLCGRNETAGSRPHSPTRVQERGVFVASVVDGSRFPITCCLPSERVIHACPVAGPRAGRTRGCPTPPPMSASAA